MAILVVAAFAMVGLFLLLGVFGGKGGPRETAPRAAAGGAPNGGAAWLSRLDPDGLEKLLHRLFAAMRFEVVQSQVVGGRLDMIVRDPTPISGGRLHVRGVLRTDSGMVTEDLVQATLDEARGEDAAKAVVISPLGFSAEARLAVQATSCQLVDAAGLTDLLAKFLPEALESQGAGYV